LFARTLHGPGFAAGQRDKWSTILFLDIEGARLSDLYDGFVKSGGKTTVCPHCAKAAGIKTDHVRLGARIATEDELAAKLVNADKIMDN